MDEYLPFLSIDWTLIFTWCNLLILYLIIKKFLFKPIMKIMSDRENEVKTLYGEAEKAKTDAEAMRREYTEHLANAKEEANEILKTANKKAVLQSEEILKEADAKAAAAREKAREQIEAEKKQAFNEVKTEISDIALLVASKVVEKDLNAKDHDRLISEFIDSVGDTKWRA